MSNERQYVTNQMVFEVKRLETCFVKHLNCERKIVQNSPRQFDEISLELQRIEETMPIDIEFYRHRNKTNRWTFAHRSILSDWFDTVADLKKCLKSRLNQFVRLFKSKKESPDRHSRT